MKLDGTTCRDLLRQATGLYTPAPLWQAYVERRVLRAVYGRQTCVPDRARDACLAGFVVDVAVVVVVE